MDLEEVFSLFPTVFLKVKVDKTWYCVAEG